MMTTPIRRIHNEFELQDLIDTLGRDPILVERDFALVTIAAGLVARFGDQICFKGGFVLRHVYGHSRFSRDLDATRINPPKNKLDSSEVAETIRQASVRNLLTLNPRQPRTDSGVSLDFDAVGYSGPIGAGNVAVEISYREDIVEQPDTIMIGEPYYEPFGVPVMVLEEIIAEKLRALPQRIRPTDLADLAMILTTREIDDVRVRRLVARKFEIVKPTDNRERITRNIQTMASNYDDAMAAVTSDAPSYELASAMISRRLSMLLP